MLLFALHVGEAEFVPHIIVWLTDFSRSGVLLSYGPSSSLSLLRVSLKHLSP